jgi:hypothetical protein
MHFIINFPSYDKQKQLISVDEKKNIINLKLCEDNLYKLSIMDLKDEELINIFNLKGINYFTDFEFPFNNFLEIEVDKNE